MQLLAAVTTASFIGGGDDRTSLSAAPTLALRACPDSLDNNEDVGSLAKRLDKAVFAYLKAYANARVEAQTP